ncbi:MAG: hypothetical protein KDG50_05685 [Chromatiales bacterium]|nr:hypothetical protein [Chromatiales bacterium]
MLRYARWANWLVALFFGALIALNYPVLKIFDHPGSVAGIPPLYLYLYVVWAVLIVIVAWLTERSR